MTHAIFVRFMCSCRSFGRVKVNLVLGGVWNWNETRSIHTDGMTAYARGIASKPALFCLLLVILPHSWRNGVWRQFTHSSAFSLLLSCDGRGLDWVWPTRTVCYTACAQIFNVDERTRGIMRFFVFLLFCSCFPVGNWSSGKIWFSEHAPVSLTSASFGNEWGGVFVVVRQIW